jgi:hypothetical protein
METTLQHDQSEDIDNFTTKLVLNVELTAFIRNDTDCIPYVKDHRGTFLAKDH